ncbi:hypothetical protein ACQ7HM_20945 [Williamsia sp. MIQD14]|uniref:hypothetical protein n=1 Tax=Williamsia sp. MIQD14 TaxID=3425703 RepID=UPI003DA075FF
MEEKSESGMVVLAKKFTPEAQAELDRQMKWREQADKNAKKAARARLAALNAQKPAIARAVAAYRRLDHGDITDVRIRSEFVHVEKGARTGAPRTAVWNRKDDLATRPPLTKLIASAGSRALPVYLTALYVAQLRANATAKAFTNNLPNLPTSGTMPCWAELAGVRSDLDSSRSPAESRRQWRRSLTTSIDSLVEYELVALTQPAGRAGKYDQFRILMDDGTKLPYKAAGESVGPLEAVRLPSAFFFNGWHLALTPAEIATLLVIADRTERLRPARRLEDDVRYVGADLKTTVRWDEYGLSDEAYNSVHMLHALGIIQLIDPMPDRARPLAVARTVTADDGTQTTRFVNQSRIPFRLVYPPADRTVDSLYTENAVAAVKAILDPET